MIKNLLIVVAIVVVLGIGIVGFLLYEPTEKVASTTDYSAVETGAFINVEGEYTGKSKLLSLKIYSLTTKDSAEFYFAYQANIYEVEAKLLKGKGIYNPKTNTIEFDQTLLGKGSLTKDAENNLLIQNKLETVSKN